MMNSTFKEITETSAKRFAESPLGRLSEGKASDKPMGEYDKPIRQASKEISFGSTAFESGVYKARVEHAQGEAAKAAERGDISVAKDYAAKAKLERQYYEEALKQEAQKKREAEELIKALKKP